MQPDMKRPRGLPILDERPTVSCRVAAIVVAYLAVVFVVGFWLAR